MLFCITAQYTPQAVSSMLDDPATNRYEAVKKLIEAADGKLVSMYACPADGPGVLVIFDLPDPNAAPSIAAIAVAGGAVQNLKLMRLLAPEELIKAQQKARQIRSAYKAPGK
jgi:uncharacterized protein with GYD domain